MAQRGFDVTKVTVSTASGSTVAVALTQYVDTISAFKINGITQETHTMGDSWVENSFVGVRSGDDITLGGFYDDATASGPHMVFGNTSDIGADRVMELDFGVSEIRNFHVIVMSYQIAPARNELTRWEMVGKVSGAISTAS